MAPKNKIIFDTDVGGDDMIGMLMAMSASPEELEVVLVSVVWGNVNVEKGLRNIIAMFHVLDMELNWRREQSRPLGFEALQAQKPVVAVGAAHALGEEIVEKKDGFHGPDGLHNVHTLHPHLSPADTWRSLFEDGVPTPPQDPSWYKYFTPSKLPAHKEILRILREEPADTITVCAVGPMTNIALAAAEDPETFLRMKQLVVMGGAVKVPGNITPVAEANTWNDAVACARVFALSSPDPSSTIPPASHCKATLGSYPEKLSKQLDIKLFPLDMTLRHYLDYERFSEAIAAQLRLGSPLALFVNTFLTGIFGKVRAQYGDNASPQLALHDPLTVWYMLSPDDSAWAFSVEDIRVETSGGWTHGMHVSDYRGKVRADGLRIKEIPGDSHGWLSSIRGNRVSRVLESPGPEAYHHTILRRIFDL